jgi:hypothetical protein
VDRDFRVNRKLRETREANQSVLQQKIEHGKHKKASKEVLAWTNAIAEFERREKEQSRQSFKTSQGESKRPLKEKKQLMNKIDVARSISKDSGAAAKQSNGHNKELFSKNETREYHIC